MLVHALCVLVLEEFAELFRFFADGPGLPLTDGARWLRLEQRWLVLIEASQESADAKWSQTTALRVLLLRLTHEVSDVVNGGLIFVLEAERLALETHLVDQDASVGLQTRESQHEVLIDALDLANGAWVLQLGHSVLLNGHHDAVVASDSNRCTATIDSFKGILHLEELAVWGENRIGFIVGGHCV